MIEYAIYKGDQFIDQGTADYLSDRLGVKRATIIWLQSPTNRKRNKGNRMVAVKVAKHLTINSYSPNMNE